MYTAKLQKGQKKQHRCVIKVIHMMCAVLSFLKPHGHMHSQTYFVMCDHLKTLPKKMSNIQNQHKKHI